MKLPRILHWATLVLCVVFASETTSFIGLALLSRSLDVPGVTTAWERRVWTDPYAHPLVSEDAVGDEHFVLSPYFGVAPKRRAEPAIGSGNESLSPYGFQGTLVRSPEPDTVVVGIFGGSVADFLTGVPGALEKISSALKSSPRFAGKKFVYTIGAIPGYKQPQSLFAYAFLLMLEAHFDAVIVLDGFNEVAVSMHYDVQRGIYPLYPQSWYDFAAGQSIGDAQGPYALPFARALLARIAHSTPLKYSFTERLVWLLADTMLDRQITRNAAQASPVAVASDSFAITGPRVDLSDTGAMLRIAANAWKEGALQMSRLAGGNGTLFFHFLQPNQYVPGSKPMGKEEARMRATNSPYIPYVRDGYPLLQVGGKQLREQGVFFHDLTGIFRSHPEPLYIDNCCHVSEAGNLIMADAMADAIRSDLRALK